LVVPDLREVLESPCDVPNSVDEILADLKKMFPEENLDFSLFDLKSKDRDFWFLKNLDKE